MLDMNVYIQGLSCISPLHSGSFSSFSVLPEPDTENALRCIEPDYKLFINPMVSRRMSRIVKMGIFSAKTCLADADLALPDAIVTGTALGCIEDTERFLISMIQNDEKLLNPSPFIQSTHNTVSSQISLFLKCHGYNATYSHRALSFENALLDASLLLRENTAETVLLGGIDELTTHSLALQQRLGLYEKPGYSQGKGIAGEGSSFLLLNKKATKETYAKITAYESFDKSHNQISICYALRDFLESNNVEISDIDTLLLGYSGNRRTDGLYKAVEALVFPELPVVSFKKICGEYQTASSFALSLGAYMLRNRMIPEILLGNNNQAKPPSSILIYNHFNNLSHSFILLQHA